MKTHACAKPGCVAALFRGAALNGVTIRHAENEDAFTIGDMKFVGFSRIIGSAYRDDIDLSDTTRSLIVDNGTGGADITTGSSRRGSSDVDEIAREGLISPAGRATPGHHSRLRCLMNFNSPPRSSRFQAVSRFHPTASRARIDLGSDRERAA